MKQSRSLRRSSCPRYGVLGAAIAGIATSAHAQEPVDEVLVTGSRIVRRDFEANSPAQF